MRASFSVDISAQPKHLAPDLAQAPIRYGSPRAIPGVPPWAPDEHAGDREKHERARDCGSSPALMFLRYGASDLNGLAEVGGLGRGAATDVAEVLRSL
jgi:hypothetical protein